MRPAEIAVDLQTVASGRLRRLRGTAAVAVLLLSACSTYQPLQQPPPLTQAPAAYESRAPARPLVFVVTLSGGGARAAAFGLGVLRELKATELQIDGRATTLLDELALISGVSGGSVLAAHYAAFGDESLRRFDAEFLRSDFEGRLLELAMSPLKLWRASSPWYGRTHLLAERLDTLYRGLTFGDLMARPQGPDLLVTATDLTTGAPFEFTPEQFALICGDLSKLPLSFAVASSSAVPLLLTPMTLRNHAGQCGPPREPLPPAAGDDSYRTRLLRAAAASYQDVQARPYVHLVDGGLVDNLGVRSVLDRIVAIGSLASAFRAASPGSIRKIVLVAVNSERDLGERIDQSDRVPTIRQVVDTLLFGAGSRLTQTTLAMMGDDVRRWRSEIEAMRGRQSSPFAADAELHLVSVSLHDIPDPVARQDALSVPTAFTISSDQVDLLIEAGRAALRRSPQYQALRAGLDGEREGARSPAARGAAGRPD
jgi:NTE family protein